MTANNLSQLTDKDIQEMLDRNNLEITFNEKTKKWELYRIVGVRKLKLGSCEYKTALLVSVKTIDRNKRS
jgi:hypothetical protein